MNPFNPFMFSPFGMPCMPTQPITNPLFGGPCAPTPFNSINGAPFISNPFNSINGNPFISNPFNFSGAPVNTNGFGSTPMMPFGVNPMSTSGFNPGAAVGMNPWSSAGSPFGSFGTPFNTTPFGTPFMNPMFGAPVFVPTPGVATNGANTSKNATMPMSFTPVFPYGFNPFMAPANCCVDSAKAA